MAITQPDNSNAVGSMQYDQAKGLKLGTSASYNSNGTPVLSSTAVNPTPNATTIQSTNPLQIPSNPIPTSSMDSLNSHVSAAMVPPSGSTVDAKTGIASTVETEKAADKSKIRSLIEQISGRGATQQTLENDLQLQQKQQAARDSFNRYNALTQQQQKQELAFQESNLGGSMADKQYKFGLIQRDNSITKANYLLDQQITSGNYKDALDTIDRKIKAIYEPIEAEIKAREQFYTLNQNDLSESEKIQLTSKIQTEKDKLKANTEATTDMAKYLAENQAPKSVVEAVDKASKDPNATPSSIIASAGKYGASLLDRKVKEANIRQSEASAASSYASAAKSRSDANSIAVGGDNPQLYSGLKPATATAVRGQVSAFKTEPVVQNFAVIQEGRNFAGSIDNKTTNPADDQALIYSLAKTLDPGSVVREGEYATAQKYSQSWIKAYGKGITQAINGTGFLSETARKNIKDTIETKYKSSLRSYDNLSKQYEQGINDLTGRSDGSKFIKSYKTPSAGQTVKAPDGQEIIITD